MVTNKKEKQFNEPTEVDYIVERICNLLRFDNQSLLRQFLLRYAKGRTDLVHSSLNSLAVIRLKEQQQSNLNFVKNTPIFTLLKIKLGIHK